MNKIRILIFFNLFTIITFAQNYDDMEFQINDSSHFTCTLSSYKGSATEIIIPETVMIDGQTFTVTQIGYGVFKNNRTINSVHFPNSIESISSSAFKGSSIKTLALPANLKKIEPYTFEDCIYLHHITLPKLLEEIGNDAFRNCTSLTSIEFPNTLKSIDDYAFYKTIHYCPVKVDK